MDGSQRNEVALYLTTISKPDELSVTTRNRCERMELLSNFKTIGLLLLEIRDVDRLTNNTSEKTKIVIKLHKQLILQST